MNKNPKVAVIGIGRWGKNIVNTLVKLGFNVSHCFSNGGQENKNWLTANHPTIQFAESYEAILSDSEIGAVFIATPIITHYSLTKQALDAGKHVFLEKPGTQSVESMQELCDLAKSKGLILSVGYVFIHHPAFAYLKQTLEGERILSVDFEWNKWGSFGENIVENLLTHDLSILIALAIRINTDSIQASYKAGIDDDKDDIINIQCTSVDGIKISSNINRLSPDKRKVITIVTSDNIYVWSNDNLQVARRHQTNPPISIEITKTSALDNELNNFMQAISGESQIIVHGEFAVPILETIKDL
jgi:predicted dehydrogenase